MSSTLTLSNVHCAGIYTFDVELQVTEAEASMGLTSLVSRVRLKTLEVVYEASYYADGQRCESAFERSEVTPELGSALQLLKNLPDPPPPDSRTVVVEAVFAAQAELLRAREPHDRQLLVNYVSSALQVHPRVFEPTLELLERQASHDSDGPK